MHWIRLQFRKIIDLYRNSRAVNTQTLLVSSVPVRQQKHTLLTQIVFRLRAIAVVAVYLFVWMRRPRCRWLLRSFWLFWCISVDIAGSAAGASASATATAAAFVMTRRIIVFIVFGLIELVVIEIIVVSVVVVVIVVIIPVVIVVVVVLVVELISTRRRVAAAVTIPGCGQPRILFCAQC